MVAVSAKTSASPSWEPLSGPGRSRYRPSTPARTAPTVSGSAKTAAAPARQAAGANAGQRDPDSGPARSEASAGPPEADASKQGPFPEGQLQLGELPADLVGHLHQVTRLPGPRGAQPGAGDPGPGNRRRAHVRGRHPPAPRGRVLRDQSPDPAEPPGIPHPCRRRGRPPRNRPGTGEPGAARVLLPRYRDRGAPGALAGTAVRAPA